MQVPSTVFYGLQVAVIAGIAVIIAAATYFVLTTDIDKAAVDTKRMAEIARMQGTADTYFARVQYFDGVCDVIGADRSHVCNESEKAYAIEIRLTSGTYYCADSTGFRGEIAESKGTHTSCN